jgi:L,D-transpeptidase YcbB
MGRIKFVLPNHLAIFLHDTSAPQLFARSRRDFSHGCIRVEKPVELALFALNGEKGWDAPRVEDAMNRREPAYANLPRPITVLVYYTTALADSEGRTFFFEDLYGHDRALARALDARRGQ